MTKRRASIAPPSPPVDVLDIGDVDETNGEVSSEEGPEECAAIMPQVCNLADDTYLDGVKVAKGQAAREGTQILSAVFSLMSFIKPSLFSIVEYTRHLRACSVVECLADSGAQGRLGCDCERATARLPRVHSV